MTVTTDCTAHADRGRLQQLFENGLCNAVEHGSIGDQNAASSSDTGEQGSTRPQPQPSEASVEQGDRGEESTAAVPVRVGLLSNDDGPGVPADQRDHRSECGTSGRDGRTELGLAIVKNIADAHDCRVRVADDGHTSGAGARFEVRSGRVATAAAVAGGRWTRRAGP
ncbi:ATP-binding protein [Halorientalis sp.]|uniref:ATP-binding protein n=1 Tax=Halorientalis sp. TaxID=1931229 RepID=UPI002639E750|nr:ATP-binding protein [Halorientalis sp.]